MQWQFSDTPGVRVSDYQRGIARGCGQIGRRRVFCLFVCLDEFPLGVNPAHQIVYLNTQSRFGHLQVLL